MAERLPDKVRIELIPILASIVSTTLGDDGYVQTSRLMAAAGALSSELARLKNKERYKTLHVMGRSPDGVPGLTEFLFLRCARYIAYPNLATPSLAEKLTNEIEKVRSQAIETLTNAYGEDAPLAAKVLGQEELLDDSYSEAWKKSWLETETRNARLLTSLSQVAPAPEQLAEEILEDFESWPHLYDFIVSLPLPRHAFEAIFGLRCTLSDSVRIEIIDEQDQERLKPFGIDGTWYVLRAAVAGYRLVDIDDPLGRMDSALRQFIGLAIAADLVEVRDLGWVIPRKGVTIELGQFSVQEFSASGFALPDRLADDDVSVDELSPEDSSVIDSLALPSKYGHPALRHMDRGWIVGRRDLWAADTQRLRQAVHEIGFAFRENNRRLLSAGEWLFGSYAGTNEALQMMQAATIFEILFGRPDRRDYEKAQLGLTELMANRCAYLLGSRPSERTAIAKSFSDIYQARSDIVHKGERRLADKTQLHAARELAKRALKRELRFLTLEDSD